MRRNPRFRPADWLLPAALVAAMLAIMLGGETAAAALRYERAAVLRGELWRLLSGHVVHADWTHLTWNVLGLLLVWVLFAGEYTVGGWLALMLASTAAIGLGFLTFEPELAWYVGLSGVLHGLMAAGLVAWLHTRRDPLTLVVAAVFLAKLAWEHVYGPLPFTAGSLSVPIVHEAHSYGAIGGTVCALVMRKRGTRAGASL